MVLAVVERDAEVHHRIPGEEALAADLLDALLDRRDEVARDRAAVDVVHELEVLAAGQRLDADAAVGELPVAAGLLLVAAVGLGLLRDRLAVGDLRRMEDDLDAVALLQARHRDLDVELRRPGEVELLGLLVALEVERGVLLDQLVEGGRDLVLVALGLRLDGVRDRRLGNRQGGQDDRVVLGRERVAGERVLELGDRDDVARVRLGDGDVLLALRQEEPREALGGALRRVPVGAVGLEVSGEHPQVRDAPGERVGDRLEDLRDRVVLLVAEDDDGLSVLADALAPGGSRARGAGPRRRRGSGPRRCPRADDAQRTGKILRSTISRFRPGRMSCGLERALREELLHEVVLALGDRLDEGLVLGLGPLGEVGGNRAVHALAALLDVRLHAHEIHGPRNAFSSPTGIWSGTTARPNFLLQRLDRRGRRRPARGPSG